MKEQIRDTLVKAAKNRKVLYYTEVGKLKKKFGPAYGGLYLITLVHFRHFSSLI